MLVDKPAAVFDLEHRALSSGILLAMTLVAFENLAVVAIAPAMAQSLNGLALYGWIFSAQLLASLFSIVLAGQQADRFGPARPFLLGLSFFALGSLLAGLAPTMLLLIFGRVLQGLGGGAMSVALYVAINLAYSDQIRARMIAIMSTAWVLPALVGPALAGLVAELLGWRFVFLGILPLVAVVAAMTIGAFLRLGRRQEAVQSRGFMALVLVVATGVLLVGLSLNRGWLFGLMVLGGGLVVLPSLHRLLPAGVLRLAKGLPSTIAARGFFYAAFIGVEAFLSLMLSSVHGFSALFTGLAIATGAISWTLGSWLQDHWDKRSPKQRHLRILLGSSLMTLGLMVQLAALYASAMPLLISLSGWLLAGLGIGIAHATTSVLAFSLAPKGEEGQVSAGLQLADTFMAALATGLGGAVFAFATKQGYAEQHAIMLAFVLSIFLAVLSIFAAFRIGELRQLR